MKPPSTHTTCALRNQTNAGSYKWSDAYIAWRCARVQQLSDLRTRREVLERIAQEELLGAILGPVLPYINLFARHPA